MIKPKGVATIMGIILISACGWVALVGLVLTDNIWVGAVLSIAGGCVIGGGVAYLIWRWWFKGIRQ